MNLIATIKFARLLPGGKEAKPNSAEWQEDLILNFDNYLTYVVKDSSSEASPRHGIH